MAGEGQAKGRRRAGEGWYAAYTWTSKPCLRGQLTLLQDIALTPLTMETRGVAAVGTVAGQACLVTVLQLMCRRLQELAQYVHTTVAHGSSPRHDQLCAKSHSQ